MKYILTIALVLSLIGCQGTTGDHKTEMKTQLDSVSYSIGLDIGKNFKKQMVEVEPEMLARGINDIAKGNKPALTDSQAELVMSAYQRTLMAKAEEKRKGDAENNKKAADKFLSENKAKEGVVTTASGLQYKVLTAGTGKKPLATETVTVHYRGTLLDGTEFDNSYKRGQPVTFPVGGVFKGWTEALQLMPVGSKWQVFIPPDLGYGDHGAGQTIPPNAVLILELELLDIKH